MVGENPPSSTYIIQQYYILQYSDTEQWFSKCGLGTLGVPKSLSRVCEATSFS